MTTLDSASTVEAKLAFERIASSNSVTIKHYHADNGLFDTKIFKKLVSEAGQTLSFCGVNAQHQNGKAKNRIKDITTGGRTSLLHAAYRWPKAIYASLWPSALKNYTKLQNSLPTEFTPGMKLGRKKLPDTYIKSPASRFSGTEVETKSQSLPSFWHAGISPQKQVTSSAIAQQMVRQGNKSRNLPLPLSQPFHFGAADPKHPNRK
jgi:hypothetical protein